MPQEDQFPEPIGAKDRQRPGPPSAHRRRRRPRAGIGVQLIDPQRASTHPSGVDGVQCFEHRGAGFVDQTVALLEGTVGRPARGPLPATVPFSRLNVCCRTPESVDTSISVSSGRRPSEVPAPGAIRRNTLGRGARRGRSLRRTPQARPHRSYSVPSAGPVRGNLGSRRVLAWPQFGCPDQDCAFKPCRAPQTFPTTTREQGVNEGRPRHAGRSRKRSSTPR